MKMIPLTLILATLHLGCNPSHNVERKYSESYDVVMKLLDECEVLVRAGSSDEIAGLDRRDPWNTTILAFVSDQPGGSILVAVAAGPDCVHHTEDDVIQTRKLPVGKKSASATADRQPEKIDPANAGKVVGYRFALPGDDRPDLPVPSGFSLLNEAGEVDFALLEKLKQSEAVLSPGQAQTLNDAVHGDNPEWIGAACYDPHHIFISYDGSARVTGVVEVCFSCTKVRTYPDLAKARWWRHDFRELARLCDEIGIGLTSGTANEMIELWDERDAK